MLSYVRIRALARNTNSCTLHCMAKKSHPALPPFSPYTSRHALEVKQTLKFREDGAGWREDEGASNIETGEWRGGRRWAGELK